MEKKIIIVFLSLRIVGLGLMYSSLNDTHSVGLFRENIHSTTTAADDDHHQVQPNTAAELWQ